MDYIKETALDIMLCNINPFSYQTAGCDTASPEVLRKAHQELDRQPGKAYFASWQGFSFFSPLTPLFCALGDMSPIRSRVLTNIYF